MNHCYFVWPILSWISRTRGKHTLSADFCIKKPSRKFSVWNQEKVRKLSLGGHFEFPQKTRATSWNQGTISKIIRKCQRKRTLKISLSMLLIKACIFTKTTPTETFLETLDNRRFIFSKQFLIGYSWIVHWSNVYKNAAKGDSLINTNFLFS